MGGSPERRRGRESVGPSPSPAGSQARPGQVKVHAISPSAGHVVVLPTLCRGEATGLLWATTLKHYAQHCGRSGQRLTGVSSAKVEKPSSRAAWLGEGQEGRWIGWAQTLPIFADNFLDANTRRPPPTWMPRLAQHCPFTLPFNTYHPS